jgi:hypothetical protein
MTAGKKLSWSVTLQEEKNCTLLKCLWGALNIFTVDKL